LKEFTCLQVVACGPVLNVPWEGPKLELVVACGSLKGGRSDWLIEKATELHAYAFTPLLTDHSSSMGGTRISKNQSDASNAGRLARWQRVATAALKQSCRVHSMKLPAHEHIWTVDEAAKVISSGTPALVAVQGGVPVLTALQSISKVLLCPSLCSIVS
jgi:RsmE family RNA methyltransferase